MSDSPPSTHHNNCSVESRFRRSEYVPSDTERSHLEAVLREETGNIQRRDEEIIILERRLANIRIEHLASKDAVTTCHSALSAHRRVPTEIWEIIFSVVCHPYSLQIDTDDDSDDPDYAECIVEAPALVLSQICSRWRKIMKGAPRLWSSISVAFGQSFSKIDTVIDTYVANAGIRKNDCLLQKSIETALPGYNAGECPLDMRIIGVKDSFYLGKPDADAWSTLSQHFTRCGALTLSVDFLNDLDDISNLSFPHLQYLCEETEPWVTKLESEWFWQAIQLESPKLTKVVLWSLDVYLPFSQITSLDIQRVDAGDIQLVYAKLPFCQRLEELILRRLDSENSSQELPTEPKLVRVGSLRKLRIDDEDSDLMPDNQMLSAFLNSMSMPSLISLELRCHDWPPSLATLAERSPLLERVSFTLREPGAPDFSSHPLFTFLQALPELKHIKLHMGTPDSPGMSKAFGDDFFAIILAKLRTNSRLVFPKLESLSLRLSDLTLSAETVERVLKVMSENSVSSALKEFRLLRNVPNVRTSAFDERFVLDSELAGKIRDLERGFGVRVVVEDVTLTPELGV